MKSKTDLSLYNNSWYQPGGTVKRFLWYLINVLFFINPLSILSSIKIILLRLFGAKVGTGVHIKPGVNIKYPWFLEIGNDVWIGENVWIDNLTNVILENNVCISQGAMLLCGNHNYKKQTFDLVVGAILLKEGSWVAAKAVVCPGVTLQTHAILAVNSVASTNLDAYAIYQGNPAVKIRERKIE